MKICEALIQRTEREDEADNLEDFLDETSDANGVENFGSLREGYYEIEATADKHGTYRATQLIAPGIVNDIEAFMTRETVSYTWTVTPVTNGIKSASFRISMRKRSISRSRFGRTTCA